MSIGAAQQHFYLTHRDICPDGPGFSVLGIVMNPNNQSSRCVRLQTVPYSKNHNPAPFQAKGWRCFISHTKNGVNWIVKRGAAVTMFAQSLTDSIEQTVLMPEGADSSELCILFVQSGIATPV